jgi:hypothetical protein
MQTGISLPCVQPPAPGPDFGHNKLNSCPAYFFIIHFNIIVLSPKIRSLEWFFPRHHNKTAMYVKHKIVASSLNNCCRGKAISITY